MSTRMTPRENHALHQLVVSVGGTVGSAPDPGMYEYRGEPVEYLGPKSPDWIPRIRKPDGVIVAIPDEDLGLLKPLSKPAAIGSQVDWGDLFDTLQSPQTSDVAFEAAVNTLEIALGRLRRGLIAAAIHEELTRHGSIPSPQQRQAYEYGLRDLAPTLLFKLLMTLQDRGVQLPPNLVPELKTRYPEWQRPRPTAGKPLIQEIQDYGRAGATALNKSKRGFVEALQWSQSTRERIAGIQDAYAALLAGGHIDAAYGWADALLDLEKERGDHDRALHFLESELASIDARMRVAINQGVVPLQISSSLIGLAPSLVPHFMREFVSKVTTFWRVKPDDYAKAMKQQHGPYNPTARTNTQQLLVSLKRESLNPGLQTASDAMLKSLAAADIVEAAALLKIPAFALFP